MAALDGPRKAEILPYLERLRDEVEVPMIYVSHDMSEVARLANTIVVLDQGRVVRAGGLGDVLSHPASVPLLGERDAGAVLLATVMEHDHEDALTALEFEGGRLILPGHIGQIGQNMRVRIPAQDVILARVAPSQISARNVLPVTVTAIEIGQGPGVAVGLMAGETRCWHELRRQVSARWNWMLAQRSMRLSRPPPSGRMTQVNSAGARRRGPQACVRPRLHALRRTR